MPALLEEFVLLPVLELVPVFGFGFEFECEFEFGFAPIVSLELELLDPVVPGVVLGVDDCAPVTAPLDAALLVLWACASVAPASPSAVSSANDLSLSMIYTSLKLSALRGEPRCIRPH